MFWITLGMFIFLLALVAFLVYLLWHEADKSERRLIVFLGLEKELQETRITLWRLQGKTLVEYCLNCKSYADQCECGKPHLVTVILPDDFPIP